MPWAVNVAARSVSSSVAGTTGQSLAFASNVAAGDVIVGASLWLSTTAGLSATFSDTSSNVTSWTAHSFLTAGFWLAIGWGVATSSAACTPKVTWNSATANIMELFTGDFTPPAGAVVAEDGAMATDNHTASSASITTPTGNGAASTDHLVVNMVGCGASFTSFNGIWTAMGASTGDDCGYVINSAGNVAANATQNASASYGSVMLALIAPSGGASPLGRVFIPIMAPQGGLM